MQGDDRPIGRLYTRREVLSLLGASSAAFFTDSELLFQQFAVTQRPPCVVRPEQIEGPYFVDEELNRSDIRSDPTNGQVKQGVPLALTFLVSRLNAGGCERLPGAQVDVWQCDALGAYSDVQDADFDTTGKKFLRGYQTTDRGAAARFTSIYPGWYPGRAVHIHFKIRTEPVNRRGFEFTSQLYFEDALTDRVHTAIPYTVRRGERRRNQNDGIYRRGGNQLLLAPTATDDGYAAMFEIALALP